MGLERRGRLAGSRISANFVSYYAAGGSSSSVALCKYILVAENDNDDFDVYPPNKCPRLLVSH